VPHYNLGAYLAETVENARHCTPPGTEIVVVDDASDDPMSRDLVGAWQRRPPAGVRVVALPFNVGLGAARNVGISEARGEYVVPLDADDLLAPGFVERAMAALQRHSAFDIVVTQAAYFEQTPAPDARPATTGFITFVGEARATGLHANRFSTAMCVMRRQTALTLRYREDLDAYEDWDMYRRALIGGCRFIVDGGVGFFYRRRADSMVHAPATKARHASLVHRVLGAHRITLGSLDLPAQALECAVVLPAMRDVGGTIDIGTLRERLEELRRFRHSRVRRLLAAIWYGGRRVARLLPASGARR
jgi:glycosyltransferase involved in cell wall biosynthesis